MPHGLHGVTLRSRPIATFPARIRWGDDSLSTATPAGVPGTPSERSLFGPRCDDGECSGRSGPHPGDPSGRANRRNEIDRTNGPLRTSWIRRAGRIHRLRRFPSASALGLTLPGSRGSPRAVSVSRSGQVRDATGSRLVRSRPAEDPSVLDGSRYSPGCFQPGSAPRPTRRILSAPHALTTALPHRRVPHTRKTATVRSGRWDRDLGLLLIVPSSPYTNQPTPRVGEDQLGKAPATRGKGARERVSPPRRRAPHSRRVLRGPG